MQIYLLLIVASLQLCCSLLAVAFRLSWVFAPMIALVALVFILQPRWAVPFFVISWFFLISLDATLTVFPPDVIFVLMVIGYVLHRLGSGKPLIAHTPLNIYFYLMAIAFAISVALSHVPVAGTINWIHHLEVFGVFFVLIGMMDETDVRRATFVFVAFCLIFSIVNINTFVLARGTVRAFGPAGVKFSGYLGLSGPFIAVACILAKTPHQRRLWAMALILVYAGQIANQSRGAMIQLMTGTAFAVIVTYRWSVANRRPEIRRRIFTRVIGLALIGSLLVLISLPLTHFVFDRFSTQHGNPLATVEMRMFLWKSALRTFLGHPVFGSGLATETIWSQILPGMRFDPMFVHTQGLSAHNSVLAYLANTGFVGSAILFVFLWRTLAMGRSIVAHVIDDERAMWRLGMLSIVFVIVTRYLYEGHLFYSVGGMSTTTFIAFMMCLKEGRSGPETSVAHRASS